MPRVASPPETAATKMSLARARETGVAVKGGVDASAGPRRNRRASRQSLGCWPWRGRCGQSRECERFAFQADAKRQRAACQVPERTCDSPSTTLRRCPRMSAKAKSATSWVRTLGRVGHPHAAFLRPFDVDSVKANAVAGDDLSLGQRSINAAEARIRRAWQSPRLPPAPARKASLSAASKLAKVVRFLHGAMSQSG